MPAQDAILATYQINRNIDNKHYTIRQANPFPFDGPVRRRAED